MAEEYEVGYGKPLRHSRFKPGQSGNPKGRAKGSRGLKSDLIAVLDGMQTISLGGREITGRRQLLTLLSLSTRGALGDIKAHRTLLPLIVQVLGVEDRGGDRRKLSSSDQALLEELLADRADSVADGEAGEGGGDA